MRRDERQELRAVIDDLERWCKQAHDVVELRRSITEAAQSATRQLRDGFVVVPYNGHPAWRVLPLRVKDASLHLAAVARVGDIPPMVHEDRSFLSQLSTEVPSAIRDARALLGARRLFSRKEAKSTGEVAAEFLTEYYAWALEIRLTDRLARLNPPRPSGTPVQAFDANALDPRVGFAARISDLGTSPELVPGTALAELPGAVHAVYRALEGDRHVRTQAVAAGNEIREAETRRMLAGMPLDRLKEATRDRLRITPLTGAGFRTVLDVIHYRGPLEALPGIGDVSAKQIRGAARALWQTTYDEMPTRIDIAHRTKQTTKLLRCLAIWDATRKLKPGNPAVDRARDLAPLARVIDGSVGHAVVLTTSRHTTGELLAAVDLVVRQSHALTETGGASGSSDPWDDFLARPADYFAMLAELGFITEDAEKAQGHLPEEIVEAVRAVTLNTEHLTASLRGYQSFGARFALVQRRVIIGDEMGLGKTVESIAVLTHLRSTGHHHFLVVCPAAVVTNWMREVDSKSTLRPYRVHGPGRADAVRGWLRSGGVAVTTFESLGWLEANVGSMPEVGCVVVDEAHYIKNPGAQRSRRTARLMAKSERSILLTGTPLENRIEEFGNLVRYVQPQLVERVDDLNPRKFRAQVAPAYLRRNQEDVLTELPELVEVDEWLPMSREDFVSYRSAVLSRNFSSMRQAAMLQGLRSEKVRRLVEIVKEAEDNGRRVIVFSHFLDVLKQVAAVIPGRVFGPLTGSVPAAARQVMVDQFASAGHGAVLVSQIIAGGVGLNIQSASVVVICEPQLKPTTEWQAIARAHRMGQLRSVQVHRLLSEDGADRRITEILARKRRTFDDFARVSATANSAPEAFDISEADLTREVVAAERERMLSEPAPEDFEEEAI